MFIKDQSIKRASAKLTPLLDGMYVTASPQMCKGSTFIKKYSYIIRILESINILYPQKNKLKKNTNYEDNKLTWWIIVPGYNPLTWRGRGRSDTERPDSERIWRVVVQYQNVLTNLHSTSRHYDTTLPNNRINYCR